MAYAPRKALLSNVTCVLLAFALGGCAHGTPGDGEPPAVDLTPEDGPLCSVELTCDESVVVQGDSPALIVTDKAALSGLSLEKVLAQIITLKGDKKVTPLELMQGLFDSMNKESQAAFDHQYHCDYYYNPAYDNWYPAMCPRAEGALAWSQGFFSPGHPDHFFPVAAVNRFDLVPAGAETCGEYRIVYAKESGLTDPNNRVFLIFEASLQNPEPGCVSACLPVAQAWRELEAEPDPGKRAELLDRFFLEGLPGFEPVISPLSFGLGPTGSFGYYGTGGQLRVSQHMDTIWEMREFSLDFHVAVNRLYWQPQVVGNNPVPVHFGPVPTYGTTDTAMNFTNKFFERNIQFLAAPRVQDITMSTLFWEASGESLQSGWESSNYAERAKDNVALHDLIAGRIWEEGAGAGCPPDDPLTSEAILRRTTVLGCAGCHAPSHMLGPDRKIGCGLTWPDSLGDVHIDEHGNLSPALREVFLPHRAEILTTFLQGCDEEAIEASLGGPTATPVAAKSLGAARTLGGRRTH